MPVTRLAGTRGFRVPGPPGPLTAPAHWPRGRHFTLGQPQARLKAGGGTDRDLLRVKFGRRARCQRRRPMQFEMRLQTVVGEFYSEVGYNFNFEKP